MPERKSTRPWTTRSLEGWVIGISVANSEDLAACGYTPEDVNRASVRLSEALLSAGARLVFGHDWRPDGIMEAICRIAVTVQPPLSDRDTPAAMIQNLLPWPTQPSLEPELRQDLEQRGILKVQTIGLPECDWSKTTDSTARAIALTHMRRELALRTHARVCLGGKLQSADGFFAGIVEEAYNAAKANQPVYLSRLLGGAAAKLIDALSASTEGGPGLRVLGPKETAYQEVQAKSPQLVPEAADLTSAFSAQKMQERSGLDPNDWQRLLNASDVEAFSALVIRGLSQLPKPGAAPAPSAKPGPTTTPPTKPRAPRKKRRR